jgi:hypothetical protein
MMGKKNGTQTWTSSQRLEASEVLQCKKHPDTVKCCPPTDDASHVPLQVAIKILPTCNLRPRRRFLANRADLEVGIRDIIGELLPTKGRGKGGGGGGEEVSRRHKKKILQRRQLTCVTRDHRSGCCARSPRS